MYNHNFILTVISFPLILDKKNNLLIIKQLHIQQCGFYTILIVLMQHVRVQSYNQESWGKVSAADARLDSARQESYKACHRDIWFFFVSVYTVVEMFY